MQINARRQGRHSLEKLLFNIQHPTFTVLICLDERNAKHIYLHLDVVGTLQWV